MDLINFRPGDVRGGGNIVSPAKTLSDFDVSDSVLTSVDDTIDGKTVSVYNLGYLGGAYFTVTSGHFVVYDDELSSISVTAVLKERSDDSAITSSSVSCIVNEDTTLTGTTGNDGSVTFSIPYDGTVNIFNIRLTYAGTNSIGGCSTYNLIIVGTLTNINLYSEKQSVLSGATCNLISMVKGTDFDTENIPIQGQQVMFFQKDVLHFNHKGTLDSQSVDDPFETFNDGRSSISVGANSTTVTGISSISYNYYANSGKVLNNNVYDYYGDCSIEFNVVSRSGTVMIFLVSQAPEGSAGYARVSQNFWSLGVSSNNHVKVVRTGDVVEWYVDDELVDTTEFACKGYYGVNIRGNENSVFEYNNFTVTSDICIDTQTSNPDGLCLTEYTGSNQGEVTFYSVTNDLKSNTVTILDYIKELSQISLSSNPQVITSGETSLITVNTLDANNEGVSDIPVMVCKYNPELFSYEGVGGTETDAFIGMNDRVTVTTDSNGTTVTPTGSELYVMWANVLDTSSSAFDFFGDVTIDFDLVSITGQGAYLQIYDGDTSHTYFHKTLGSSGMGATTGSHIRVTVTDGLVEVYVDGVLKSNVTTQTNFTNNYRIGFKGSGNMSFKFKNFSIGGF